MRISKEMAKGINNQISYEASSANAYIAVGSWCERIGYDGSAPFFLNKLRRKWTYVKVYPLS